MKLARTALALLLALSIPSWSRNALADPPPEVFAIHFDGDAAIWNPFDEFSACETATEQGLTVTQCLFLDNVFCDGAGRCTCDVGFTFDGDIDGSLTGPCTAARLSCKATPDDPTDDVCKAKLKFDVSGPVAITKPFPVTCAAELLNGVSNGFVDSEGSYGGTGKGKLCVDCGAQRVCQRISGDFEYPGNPPFPWDLTVQVAPDPANPNTLVGGATDSLGFEYTAKGQYNATDDESTILLKGVTRKADPESVSQGAKIELGELGCDAGGCSDGTATFKVQGNKAKDAPVGP